eukprot:s220_g25.t1
MADLNSEMLAENIKILQNEVSTRNQVIRDIETKFTEYLRGYYQNVNSEFQMLNDRLAGSTIEVREYQAELMVAAQDDEGSTMRIQDLEQKRNLAEDVAKRIYEKGMIMREEYQDQAIADLRVRSQEVEDLRKQNERLQTMLKVENETSQDYWDRLQVYIQADEARQDGLPAFGGADRSPRVETLESEVKIQQLKINDMVDEASEYVKENLRLKDQVHELTMSGDGRVGLFDIDKVRSELLTERKSNLVKISEKDQTIWRLNKDQEDKRISILGKEGEISMLKAKIQDLESRPRTHPYDQSFSAGIPGDQDTQRLVQELQDALEKEKSDHAVTRSYYRQVDEAYNEEVREIERLRQGGGDGNDGQVPEPTRSNKEAPNQRGSNERLPDSDVVSWQSDVAKGVILAANDGDRAAWQEWLQPALGRHPDLDALNDSGGQRFQSIDTKLSIVLSNMIQQAGDVARNVSMQLRHRTQAAGRNGGFVMGREILAMVLNHFRTPGVSETMFTMEHLVKMTYYGDAHLDQFYDKWMEMVNNMRPEDVPPDDWMRRSLYSKIRHSNLLMFDIKQYESWEEGDERKTYQHLRNVIERTIARLKEDKHAAARDKYAREYAGTGKPGTPAPATPTPKAGNENAPDAKAKAKPKAKAKVEAAPVLPSPSPKNHAKGKGKGKGDGTPRKPGASQSPSPKDKKKIPCHFHFVKKACKKGKDCEYSHDQKVFDNMKKKKDGKNSRSQSPRSKSPANKPKKIDEPCWNWAEEEGWEEQQKSISKKQVSSQQAKED